MSELLVFLKVLFAVSRGLSQLHVNKTDNKSRQGPNVDQSAAVLFSPYYIQLSNRNRPQLSKPNPTST